MNELHDSRELHMMLATIAGRPGGKENERRAQPLAASCDDVLRDLAYEHHVGLEPTPDHGIHRKHVCGDEVAKRFGLQGGLSHCGIDLTAGQEGGAYFFYPTPQMITDIADFASNDKPREHRTREHPVTNT